MHSIPGGDGGHPGGPGGRERASTHPFFRPCPGSQRARASRSCPRRTFARCAEAYSRDRRLAPAVTSEARSAQSCAAGGRGLAVARQSLRRIAKGVTTSLAQSSQICGLVSAPNQCGLNGRPQPAQGSSWPLLTRRDLANMTLSIGCMLSTSSHRTLTHLLMSGFIRNCSKTAVAPMDKPDLYRWRWALPPFHVIKINGDPRWFVRGPPQSRLPTMVGSTESGLPSFAVPPPGGRAKTDQRQSQHSERSGHRNRADVQRRLAGEWQEVDDAVV